MFKISIICICFSLVQSQSCTNNSEIVDAIFKNYNKYQVPGGSTEVTVEIWIQEMTSITWDSELSMDFYLSEMWHDPALRFDHMNPCVQNMSLPYQVMDKIWGPNTAFVNSKWQSLHKSLYANLFFLLYANGTVWTNSRTKIGAPCQFDLSRFPADSPECHLTLESFNYNTEQVKMDWTPGGVYQLKNFELSEFSLIDIINYRNEVVIV